ncbi:hypothetical protein LCGC14_0112970 [marine sediment metagenome]|jgi:hypothetical protein|uniref:Uncharacterized protein n=2 Tax=root TaxID=1 RepID=A0A7V1FLT0_9RHOB|nr:hypothetical protein [Sulfitobacter litoralis]HDZ51435.1 hypothetical protein [Sulfitobacter litoralis]
MIAESENDTRELRTFARFIQERAAHKELERVTGKELPMETATVKREWWDPLNEFPRAPEPGTE